MQVRSFEDSDADLHVKQLLIPNPQFETACANRRGKKRQQQGQLSGGKLNNTIFLIWMI